MATEADRLLRQRQARERAEAEKCKLAQTSQYPVQFAVCKRQIEEESRAVLRLLANKGYPYMVSVRAMSKPSHKGIFFTNPAEYDYFAGWVIDKDVQYNELCADTEWCTYLLSDGRIINERYSGESGTIMDVTTNPRHQLALLEIALDGIRSLRERLHDRRDDSY